MGSDGIWESQKGGWMGGGWRNGHKLRLNRCMGWKWKDSFTGDQFALRGDLKFRFRIQIWFLCLCLTKTRENREYLLVYDSLKTLKVFEFGWFCDQLRLKEHIYQAHALAY